MSRFFLWIIATTLVLAGIYVGYNYYRKVKMPRSEVMSAVPADAAMVLKIRNCENLWSEVQRSKWWTPLLESKTIKALNAQLRAVDSLFKSNSDIKELLESQPVYISFHPTRYNDFDFLYLVSIPEVDAQEFVDKTIKNILGDKVPFTRRDYNGTPIIEFPINIASGSKIISYSILKGIFLCGFSSVLIENSLKRLSEAKTRPDSLLLKAIAAEGDKIDANLYINYSNLPKLIGNYTTLENQPYLNATKDFALWTELDVKLKSDGLLLNGTTPLHENQNAYLASLLKQEPQLIKLPTVLPQQTAQFFYWGVKNMRSYYNDYQHYLSKCPLKSEKFQHTIVKKQLLKEFSESFKMNIEENMLGWMNNEMALAFTEAIDTSLNNNALAVFHAKSTVEASTLLEELAEASKNGAEREETTYNGNKIGKVNIPNLLSLLFGDIFGKIKNNYYTIISDYVVFANSPLALQSIIDDNLEQHVLAREGSYKKLEQKLGNKTNFFIYTQSEKAENIYKSFANDSLTKTIEQNSPYINKFNAIGLQFTASKDFCGFYNNGYILTESSQTQNTETNLLWTLELDTTIATTPQFVNTYTNTSKQILVQDVQNGLYMVDNTGLIAWKRTLPGRITSKIYCIDYFKNGKTQYVFSTKQQIYLIDDKGKNMNRFPVKLPATATSPVNVLDYDHKKEYRIMIACKNTKRTEIEAYDATGKPLDGWSFNTLLHNVTQPVQFYKLGDKDYMIISDNDGSVYLTDRKGKLKTTLDKEFVTSPNNTWVYDDTDQPHFLTTDTAGNIRYLYPDGTTNAEFVEEVSPYHSFNFDDVNGDGLKDFVFLDNNKLSVVKQDTTSIFNYTFPTSDNTQEQSTKPNYCKVVTLSNNKKSIIAVSNNINKVFMFNADGSIYNGFPVKGNTGFDFSIIKSGDARNSAILTVGLDKKLFLYSVH